MPQCKLIHVEHKVHSAQHCVTCEYHKGVQQYHFLFITAADWSEKPAGNVMNTCKAKAMHQAQPSNNLSVQRWCSS